MGFKIVDDIDFATFCTPEDGLAKHYLHTYTYIHIHIHTYTYIYIHIYLLNCLVLGIYI